MKFPLLLVGCQLPAKHAEISVCYKYLLFRVKKNIVIRMPLLQTQEDSLLATLVADL